MLKSVVLLSYFLTDCIYTAAESAAVDALSPIT